MTYRPEPTDFAIPPVHPTQDDFALARVAMIEGFVCLEVTIAKILSAHAIDFDLSSPFNLKLKTLAQLTSPPLSKKATDRFRGLSRELSRLSRIRNDIVHGKMTLAHHRGVAKAAFQNAADAAIDLPQFSLLTIDDLKDAEQALRSLANQLKQLAHPPSPPPPSPGAAGGP
ncbi:MAG: hypothetical protein ACKVOP_08720 [Sphingomonadaceae bacterium]